jgi:hypothetical protein
MAVEHILAKKEELSWDIYVDRTVSYSEWNEDYSTDAPDGEYSVNIMAYNYNCDSGEDFKWDSDTNVVVKDGQIDLDSALTTAAELMMKCGYWGVFIETFNYDKLNNQFELGMGS